MFHFNDICEYVIARARVAPEQRDLFDARLIGALSAKVSPEAWEQALTLATQLTEEV